MNNIGYSIFKTMEKTRNFIAIKKTKGKNWLKLVPY
jgi:hypothetical protein